MSETDEKGNCSKKYWNNYKECPKEKSTTSKKATLREEFNTVLDMAAGADGGITAVYILQFLKQCEEENTDVPFVRQFARLCRTFKNGWPEQSGIEKR